MRKYVPSDYMVDAITNAIDDREGEYVKVEDLPRWIAVTESLPEIDVEVLVCYQGSMWVGSVDADGEFRDEEGRLNCDHWMPLPDPPRCEVR